MTYLFILSNNLFRRIDFKDCSVEEQNKISHYIHQLTYLSMLGVETLWKDNDNILINDVDSCHFNPTIVMACNELLMRMAMMHGYDEVLRKECFDVLIKNLKDSIISGDI